jgi:hypothetical protein
MDTGCGSSLLPCGAQTELVNQANQGFAQIANRPTLSRPSVQSPCCSTVKKNYLEMMLLSKQSKHVKTRGGFMYLLFTVCNI